MSLATHPPARPGSLLARFDAGLVLMAATSHLAVDGIDVDVIVPKPFATADFETLLLHFWGDAG